MSEATCQGCHQCQWGGIQPCPSQSDAYRRARKALNGRQFPDLKNGGRVLEAVPSPGKGATRSGYIVLADIREQSVQPFATWWVDEEGYAATGHYFDRIAEAVQDFTERSARGY
jgi:hypothetical protein